MEPARAGWFGRSTIDHQPSALEERTVTTEPRPVRFGYVGCGFMAQKVHLPNFSRIPGCELLALAEVRTGLRDRVADRYAIPRRYASHEEIACDPEIEAVGVSAGFTLQGQMARDLLKAGKHVFMEKPMAV